MPRHMAVIKCQFVAVKDAYGDGTQRLIALSGEGDLYQITTSKIKTIDFERGMAVTQNNIYIWDVPKP